MRASLVGLLVCLTSVAFADDETEAPAPGASEYVTQVRAAVEQLHAGDVDGAISALRTAAAANPGSAAAHCHLGTALLRQEQNGPALESFRTCARLARQAGDPLHEGRGLLNTARVLLIDSNGREAREAVAALVTFSQTHPTVLPAEVSAGMQRALEAISALDTTAAAVRQRREARAAAADAD